MDRHSNNNRNKDFLHSFSSAAWTHSDPDARRESTLRRKKRPKISS
jgi:hypothetical protein